MLSFLFPKNKKETRPLIADIHSHLIPGVDDGVKTSQESFDVIRRLMDLGYSKIITTPHVMADFYGNTTASLTAAYDAFLVELKKEDLPVTFEIAAEYYLDEKLTDAVRNREKLLTFGNKYLLFETNVISEPMNLKDFIFSLTSQGLHPILAHPERYQYMTLEKATDLRDRGVLLQINLLSLIGFYGPPMQKLAEKLIQHGCCDVLGSDCHHAGHAALIKKVQELKSYRKALDLPLLNYTL